MMFYPNEFKEMVKITYPECKELNTLMDMGNVELVGEFLRSNSSPGVTFEAILASNSLEELKRDARNEKMKKDVFVRWFELFEDEYRSKKENEEEYE